MGGYAEVVDEPADAYGLAAVDLLLDRQAHWGHVSCGMPAFGAARRLLLTLIVRCHGGLGVSFYSFLLAGAFLLLLSRRD